MSNLLEQVNEQIARIQALIPPDEDLQNYLRQVLNKHLEAIATETSMGIVPINQQQASIQRYTSARMAVELINQPDELATRPEGIIDTGVIQWLLRPALLLKEGQFEPVSSGLWKNLAGDIVKLEANAVCRLDMKVEGYSSTHLGTGFIIGTVREQFIIMTNAHVVEEALRWGWPKMEGLQFGCDFARYVTGGNTLLYELAGVYRIHPHYDLALLYLPQEKLGTNALPILKLSSLAPSPITNLQVGVIGHPSFDSRLDPFPRYFGFGDQIGVKRFSPGYVKMIEEKFWRNQYVTALLHDATTLSGSSGSCVIDIDSKKVVGLHFGGWPKPKQQVSLSGTDLVASLFYSNGAVPLWALRDDPFLSEVSFS